MNCEPSWRTIGEIVCRQIEENAFNLGVANSVCDIVRQMAEIAAVAREQQIETLTVFEPPANLIECE